MFEFRTPSLRIDTPQILALFRQTIARELSTHALNTSRHDPMTFELTQVGGTEPALSVNIFNIVQEILASGYGPAEARHRIAQFAGMVASALQPMAVDRRALYLALRHHDYCERLEAAKLDFDAACDLRPVLAVDRGAYISLPSAEAVRAAGLDMDEARRLAEENLLGVIHRLELWEQDRGVRALVLEDYEWLSSSLLLVPGVLCSIAAGLGWERMLIAGPSVDALLVADAGREDAVEVLGDLMRESFGVARVNSECVFRVAAKGAPKLHLTRVMRDGSLIAPS